MANEAIGSDVSGPMQRLGISIQVNNSAKRCTYVPTNSKPILPPSHNAQDRPRHVKMCTLGPSLAPLKDRVCRTNGTWFVTRPRARKGTNSRGCGDGFGAEALTEFGRARFRGGSCKVSISVAAAILIVQAAQVQQSGCPTERLRRSAK